jgi:hypothetical protein
MSRIAVTKAFQRVWVGAQIALCVLAGGCTTARTKVPEGVNIIREGTWPDGPQFDRVLIIVLENQSYLDALADPYLKDLAENKGVSFPKFFGLYHPSYANYISMICGTEVTTNGDNQKDFSQPTIADLRDTRGKGITWKNYAEGYPGGPGKAFDGSAYGRYVRKHVPFASFRRQASWGQDATRIVSDDQFDRDVLAGDLPQYMFYSPDLDHDGHDPVSNPKEGLRKSTTWLRDFLDRRFPQSIRDHHRVLTIITYDEAAGSDASNQIYTVFLGNMLKSPGEIPQDVLRRGYDHFSVLRTIEANFGLGTLGEGDGSRGPILGIWKDAPATSPTALSHSPVQH